MWRIGLLGASKIARGAVIAPAKTNADFEVVAVGARDPGRARVYADEHGIPHVAGSYAELVARDDVDVVSAGGVHQQRLGHRRPAIGAAGDQQLPDRLGALRPARLPSGDHGLCAPAQSLGEPLRLGRFAGPLAAFERDESSAGHERQMWGKAWVCPAPGQPGLRAAAATAIGWRPTAAATLGAARARS